MEGRGGPQIGYSRIGWEEGTAVEGGWEEAHRLGIAGEASHTGPLIVGPLMLTPFSPQNQLLNTKPTLPFSCTLPPSTLPSPTHPTHTLAK